MTGIAVLLGLLVAATGRPGGSAPDLGTYAPDLTRWLTPPGVPDGTYRIFVSDVPLDARVDALSEADPERAPGEWTVEQAEALGALGAAMTPRDRARLARLFGGRRVRVARGAIRDGRLVAYALVSPYPDPTFTRIVEGTMAIVFVVPEE